MANIIWLVSYPKSGNTWFRNFISNLISGKEEPIHINDMLTDGIASGRAVFDEITGLESSDMTYEEIDELRHDVYSKLGENCKKTTYFKVHDAYTYLKDGRSMFPSNNARAVYILRNPLDVAVSFSFHLSKTIDQTIELMNRSKFSFCGRNDRMDLQLRQQLLKWDEHITSWVDNCEMPLHVVKYEDMLATPFETFKKAVEFMGVDATDERIKKAIEFSDFKILKKQEELSSFNEKPNGQKSFFREGKARNWEKHLSKDQIERIVKNHFDVMRKFGYIDMEGNII